MHFYSWSELKQNVTGFHRLSVDSATNLSVDSATNLFFFVTGFHNLSVNSAASFSFFHWIPQAQFNCFSMYSRGPIFSSPDFCRLVNVSASERLFSAFATKI